MVIGRIGRISSFRGDSASFSPATRIAVFAPVLAVMAVGVRARYYPDSVEPWHANQAAHERVMAYGKMLSETEDALKQSSGHIDPEQTKEAANKWIAAGKDGTLKPLKPQFYVDTTMEGPKSEVERAVGRLSGSLMALAENARQKGSADQAVEYALLAYRVTEITRTSDLTTLATGAARQRRTMGTLSQVLPQASAKWKSEAKAVIEGERAPLLGTLELALEQREDWGERYGQAPLPDKLRNRLFEWAKSNPTEPEVSAGDIKHELANVEDRSGAEVVFNAGRAIGNEWKFEAMRRKAAATLN
ncbi:hypothetical protein EON81_10790 [bacterium]|nr:MAG: hypothetical protein EON81_10790 [bacterium]